MSAQDDDVSYPEELVETYLSRYTEPGDLVSDPFAGFGTTLVVAERLDRRALGVELLPDRVAHVRRRLADPTAIIEGDARRLVEFELPQVDFTMTSPPYMNKVNHPQNPLTGYRTMDGDYTRYLDEVGFIFANVAGLLKPGGRLVLNVADIWTGDVETPLARDVAARVAAHLALEAEHVIDAPVPDPTIGRKCCFVFRRAEASRVT